MAAENHSMVYSFLNEKKLPEDDYYDIVVFGYLCAIQDYCEKKSLKHYKLSTIAWRRMNREINSHFRAFNAQKRRHDPVSLQDPLGDESERCLQDILADPCNPLDLLQAELFLHSLAVSSRARRIIHMKMKGYGMHEIAKEEKMTFKAIKEMLAELRPAIQNALNE